MVARAGEVRKREVVGHDRARGHDDIVGREGNAILRGRVDRGDTLTELHRAGGGTICEGQIMVEDGLVGVELLELREGPGADVGSCNQVEPMAAWREEEEVP